MEVIKKKMSNLKVKLEVAETAAEEAERELEETLEKIKEQQQLLEELETEVNELEDDQEEKDSRVSFLSEQYETAEKTSEENRRAHAELKNRGQIDSTQQSKLEEELELLLEEIDEFEAKYTTLSEEVDVLETDLDTCDTAGHDLDCRVKELELESVNIGNTLRSQEINQEKATSAYDASCCKLEQLEEKCKDIEEKVHCFETKAAELEAEHEQLEECLDEKKKEHECAKEEFDTLMGELEDL